MVRESYRDMLRRVATVCKREGDRVDEDAGEIRKLLTAFEDAGQVPDAYVVNHETELAHRAEEQWTCANLARSLLGPEPAEIIAVADAEPRPGGCKSCFGLGYVYKMDPDDGVHHQLRRQVPCPRCSPTMSSRRP